MLDLIEKVEDYIVVQSADKKVIYLALDEKLELDEPKEENKKDEDKTDDKAENVPSDSKDDEIGKTDADNSEIPDNSNNANDKTDVDNSNDMSQDKVEIDGEKEEKIDYKLTISAIKYNSTSNRTRIMFDGKLGDYHTFTLENPKRLVIDIYDAKLDVDGPTIINPKNKVITEIEIAQYDETTVRVVFDLLSTVEHQIKERSDELQVDIEEPTYKNIEYTQGEESATLKLVGVNLNNLTLKKNKSKNTYTISYSSSKFKTGSGTIDASDSFVQKISITKSKITINAKSNMSYSAKQVGDDVVITMKKSNGNSDKIILLDAGHGGSDPGSSNGSYYEKKFNLAILLKLKEMLEDEGYTVYATRETDTTLTVNDRVSIATEDYPEASLYVSIHNNSVENKNYSGTLVMYCPRDTSEYGITNKQFASYVLEELVEKLDTINRGFIVVKETDTSKRVLTEVPMPSILCEVAFVSNDAEVARLNTDEFQESAALAIFNGIEKALDDME